MCGRYASSRKPEDLVEEFEITASGANKVDEALAPDYNVAPDQAGVRRDGALAVVP